MKASTLALLAFLLAACQAGETPPAEAETGTLAIQAVFEPPAGNEPINIGGYAFYATVGELVEEEIPFDGTLRVRLPAGTHALTIVTRPMSDTVTIVDGEEQRDVYDVTAECDAEVEVSAGGETTLTYRAIGGGTCDIEVGEG